MSGTPANIFIQERRSPRNQKLHLTMVISVSLQHHLEILHDLNERLISHANVRLKKHQPNFAALLLRKVKSLQSTQQGSDYQLVWQCLLGLMSHLGGHAISVRCFPVYPLLANYSFYVAAFECEGILRLFRSEAPLFSSPEESCRELERDGYNWLHVCG